MSKRGKPTQAIMIEVSGNTVWAHVANACGEHLECIAGYAKCHPNDTFDFYEGARIALARAFGKNPFPKTGEEETTKATFVEKPKKVPGIIDHPSLGRGRWVKAGNGNTGKVGDMIRIDSPWMSDGLYKKGDILKIQVAEVAGCRVSIGDTFFGKFIATSEYSIWVPEKAEKKKPEPITPSFCVGDYVKTGNMPFDHTCRNRPGMIKRVTQTGRDCILYDICVLRANGTEVDQSCSETRYGPAPLTLLWREEK